MAVISALRPSATDPAALSARLALGPPPTGTRMPLPCCPQRMAVATSSSPAAAPARVIGISRRGRLALNRGSDHLLGALQDGRPGVAADRAPALPDAALVEGALNLPRHLGAIRA